MPNVSTRIAKKITSQTIDVLRLAEGLRVEVIKDLETLESDLVYDLMRAAGKSDLSIARMQALLTQARSTINTAYGNIAVAFTPQLKEAAIAVARQTAEAVNGIVRVELMSVGLSKEQIEYIAGKTVIEGHVQASWWKAQASSLRNNFTRQMRQGQYRGESVDQLIRRIRGTKASGFTDGVMNAPRYQAEALVRTGVMSVANEAKLASYLNNRDVIKGIQWHATLEGACDICAELNGKIWLLPKSGDKDDDYIPDGHDTPFPGAIEHFNCRCIQVAITYSFKELAAMENG